MSDPRRTLRSVGWTVSLLFAVGCAAHAPADRSSQPGSSPHAAQRSAPVSALGPTPPADVSAQNSEAPAPKTLSASDLPATIASRLDQDPASLGAMSVGRPNRGALFNGVVMPEGPFWEVVDAKHAFATEETIASLTRAIETVNAQYPGSPKLYVGQISAEHGGYLRPHRSHQNGRDVDLGYYYQGGPHWYTRANAKTLDLTRTWALVKALALDPNIETMFIDRSVQHLLRDHALLRHEDAAWLDRLFESPHGRDTLIRHAWGHLTHVHVRFRCPRAQQAGITAHESLVALHKIPPRKYY